MIYLQDKLSILVNHKTMEYSRYCKNIIQFYVVDILI